MPSICTKPLTAGEVVIECKPLVHIIKCKFKGKHCDNCLQRSESLKRCPKCLQMFYCDKNCQTFDWIYHKNECKQYGRRVGLFGGDLNTLCLRFMLCIKNDKTFATKRHQLIDGSDVCLNDIDVNVDELLKTTEQKRYFELFVYIFEDLGFDRKELLHWFGVSNQKCSVIPLIDYSKELKEEFCFGLYIETCFLSHSCLPNAGVVNNGLTLQVRAMKAIGSGEELTISYIDLTQNKTGRQNRLKEYSIDCKCLKCEQNLDSGLDCFETMGGLMTFLPKNEIISGYISNLTAFFGPFLTGKTLALENLFRKLHDLSPESKAEIMISTLVKHLKEAIAITHGESHPLAKALDQLFAEY